MQKNYFNHCQQPHTVVPATEGAALYICEICEKCAEPLHIGEITCPEFYNEIVQMLNDTDEKNFLIYRGAFPCAWLKLNGFTDDTGWLSMLAVMPSFQRRGVGEFAVGFAEKYLTDKGIRYIRIHTDEDNAPARALYEKCGYALVDSRRTSERTTLTFEKTLTNLRQFR
ncbi:MAG: GNAT family N-acetyltransferase [Ruminococcaceae bacterium]|nr:GNAT family N-acetyltransferase [Oscillospiraceae bacterium]